jgi:hypothetical protein
MSAGCPVILSDRTPWRDLERCGAGWAIPLENRHAFIRVIERCIEMSQAEYEELSRGVLKYYCDYVNNLESVERTINMLKDAMRGPKGI